MAARKRLRLNDRAIRRMAAGLHADGDGLLLQVSDTGAKSWILRTVVRRKRRDMGLGGWPMVPLREARERASRFRKVARDGGDPLAERDKAGVAIPSFREAAEIAHKERASSWRNKKHAAQWLSTLQAFVYPTLGDVRVDEIRSEHVVRAIAPIWLLRAETARRVLQRIGTVLLWAKGNGYRRDSPTDEIAAAIEFETFNSFEKPRTPG